MIHAQNAKYVNLIAPVAAVNNANAVAATIDTLGFDYCEIVVNFGVLSTSGISTLKVQESDFSNMSGAADVAGAVFGTSTNIAGATSALPVHTDDNTVWGIEIDLKARKRYLKPILTVDNAGTGAFVAGVARLSRAETSPTTAAQKGLTGALRVE